MSTVFGILQRLRLEDCPVPGGVAPELLYGAGDRFLGFADGTQASGNDVGRAVDMHGFLIKKGLAFQGDRGDIGFFV